MRAKRISNRINCTCGAKLDGSSKTYCKVCNYKTSTKSLLKLYGTTNTRLIPKYVDHIRKHDKEYQKEKRARLIGFKAKEYRIYCQKYPEKVRAQQALNRAVRKGLIKKESCRDCGVFEKVIAHHENYAEPYKVLWVCSIHHKNYHPK